MKNDLIIHERLNTNAQRVNHGESLFARLNSQNKHTRKFYKEFIQLQLWFMKNNIKPNRQPSTFPF